MPLVNGYYVPKNAEWLKAGKPTGVWRENFPRHLINTDLAALTTQVMTSVAIPLQTGDIITSITFKSGATAAGTPTNWWFALYEDADLSLVAQTADQLTAAWAANTAKTLALSSAFKVDAPGVYYAAVMVKATTVPTLIGFSGFLGGMSGVLTADKSLAQTSGAALTTTAPATIATPTAVATVPYVVLS